LKVPEREGILRAIDGQHRLLALHADIDNIRSEEFTVPAIIFDRLPEDHVVQMFVTINAKHTRLNASHLVSLSGVSCIATRRWLPRTTSCARSTIARTRHCTTRSSCSAWARARGAGAARAGAEEAVLERCVWRATKTTEFLGDSKRFFVNLLQAGIGRVWRSVERTQVQHQVSGGLARVHPGRLRMWCAGSIRNMPTAATSARIGRAIARWGRRIGDLRFETEGAWKRTGTTVDALARELKLALEYPEGAGV
jgi:hypothetical protein